MLKNIMKTIKKNYIVLILSWIIIFISTLITKRSLIGITITWTGVSIGFIIVMMHFDKDK
jgi:hypothetical protein